MKLRNLTIKKLEIPFKMAFSHASATRSVTDSVIAVAKSENHTGYGESCPRAYVTAETFQTITAFYQQHRESILDSVTDIQSLKEWVTAHADAIDQHPAAWCALELALLDLLAKESVYCVEHLLGLEPLTGSFQYTAILGDSSIGSFEELLAQYKAMGFSDYKLKLSGVAEQDRRKCELVLSQVKEARIRLDANNLWHRPDEVVSYMRSLQSNCFALEEPLQANDYVGLSRIADSTGIKIILDESFVKQQQFTQLSKSLSNWVVNIRISKMGGLLRSIAIAKQAREAGIPCIVGAQVGETSLLTRAALTLANSFRDVTLAQEGACGTYLLEHDIFQPVLMFDKGGVIGQRQLNQLGQRGFGLNKAPAFDYSY